MKLSFSPLLICLISFFPLFLNAQTIQKGRVILQNSGHKTLPGVQVMALGAQPADTDIDGSFRLSFDKAQPGALTPISMVYKKGYELVNGHETSRWILSDSKEMVIVMCPAGELLEAKEKYYQIGTSIYIKRYEAALEEIGQQRESNRISEKEYADHLEKAYNELNNSQKLLTEYADMFARINKDDLSELENKAFVLLENGKLDEAIALYENEKLLDKIQQQIQLEKTATADIHEMIPSLKRYADLCVFAGGTVHLAKASDVYKTIALSDLSNYDNLFEYGIFLRNIVQYQSSVEWLTKALNCAKTKIEIAKTQKEIGETLIEMKDFNQAKLFLDKSLSIYKAESKESERYLANCASVYVILANGYCLQNDFQNAWTFINKSHQDNQSAIVYDSLLYIENNTRIAGIESYVLFYPFVYSTGNLDTIVMEQKLLNVVNLSSGILKKDSVKYIDFYIKALSNMGSFYSETGQFEKAIDYYSLCLSVLHKQHINNPYKANIELGTLNNVMAKLYDKMGIRDSSEVYFMKAIEIRENMASINPNSFLLPLAVSYFDYGFIQLKNKDCESANTYIPKSFELFQKLYSSDEKTYSENVVYSYIGMAELALKCDSVEGISKALDFYKKDEAILEKHKHLVSYNTIMLTIHLRLFQLYKITNNHQWRKYFRKTNATYLSTQNSFGEKATFFLMTKTFRRKFMNEYLKADF